MTVWNIRLLETIEEMSAVEELQREVWPGSETDVVPAHVLITAAHNGGVLLGAFVDDKLIGFIFGFPGLESTPDGPRPKHCSHILGVDPNHRDSGVGFALKRAQWQMVRHQGLDHVTWTYDPLLSRNAHLNIARLGAVCSTYRRSEYGDMRDGLNAGLPSDRFQVDWWINTKRVEQRLSKRARPTLNLNQLARVGVHPLYLLPSGPDNLPRPPEHLPALEAQLIAAYAGPWRALLSGHAIVNALSMAPLLAAFAYAVGSPSWSDQEKLRNPNVAAYLRSLTRRMKREADQLVDRRAPCLS